MKPTITSNTKNDDIDDDESDSEYIGYVINDELHKMIRDCRVPYNDAFNLLHIQCEDITLYDCRMKDYCINMIWNDSGNDTPNFDKFHYNCNLFLLS